MTTELDVLTEPRLLIWADGATLERPGESEAYATWLPRRVRRHHPMWRRFNFAELTPMRGHDDLDLMTWVSEQKMLDLCAKHAPRVMQVNREPHTGPRS